MTTDWSRRRFLAWLGRTPPAFALAAGLPRSAWAAGETARVTPLEPTRADTLSLAAGLAYHVIAREGDVINARGEVFGTGNDHLQFFPLSARDGRGQTSGEAAQYAPQGQGGAAGPDDGLLWVNHEYPVELFLNGKPADQPKTKAEVVRQRMMIGGSIIRIKRDPATRRWAMVRDDQYNRRITAETPIPLVAPRPIAGSMTAIGTLANCAGGKTPWNTVLTCEENYDLFYGEVDYKSGDASTRRTSDKRPLRWQDHFPMPPEHYGWVVEVDPFTGSAKKLTALGRFAHECATIRQARDGRCVVYSGSDENLGCLYKFIADAPGTLERGTLYVASFEARRWIPLTWADQPSLKKTYKDQLEVLIRARDAGPLVGGSRLDRPEGIAIDPTTGSVLVSFTKNTVRRNYYGSIVRIDESDPLALTFEHSTFLAGGKSTGFACPDQLVFDPCANLWFTTGVSADDLYGATYGEFLNNALYVVPTSGPDAGRPLRVVAGPVEAELTGPLFARDGRTLFLAVQHPGEESPSLERPSSRWPDGPGHLPKSAVVAVEGRLLDAISAHPEV